MMLTKWISTVLIFETFIVIENNAIKTQNL